MTDRRRHGDDGNGFETGNFAVEDRVAGAAGHQRHLDGGLGDIQQVLLGEGVDHGVAHTSLC